MATHELPIPARKQFRLDDLFTDSLNVSDSADESTVDRDLLRVNARWIRDDLDPAVASEGPGYLKADQVVILFKFINHLREARVSLDDIRWSRIHYAMNCIAGRATRWPGTLIEEADKLLESWTIRFGPINEIQSILYEEGGRLHGICTPDDLNKEVLEIRWLRAKDSKVLGGYTFHRGDLGLKPGDWWINSMFAYHAGVLDNGIPTGRVIADKHAAYAILLNGDDEINSSDPRRFTYRARSTDIGRHKLTAANPASRHPIRVLRSHTLRSFWAPRAGIRYEGLYKVIGWRMKYNGVKKDWTYDIDLERLETESPMTEVLRHPLSDELDDYKEYKRIRQVTKLNKNQFHRAKPLHDVEVHTKSIPNITPIPHITPISAVEISLPKIEDAVDYFNLPITTTRPAQSPGARSITPSLRRPTTPMWIKLTPKLFTPSGRTA